MFSINFIIVTQDFTASTTTNFAKNISSAATLDRIKTTPKSTIVTIQTAITTELTTISTPTSSTTTVTTTIPSKIVQFVWLWDERYRENLSSYNNLILSLWLNGYINSFTRLLSKLPKIIRILEKVGKLNLFLF